MNNNLIKSEEQFSIFDWYKKVVFQNYANFSGRARRKEYWQYQLVQIIIMLLFVLCMVPIIVMNDDGDKPPIVFYLILAVMVLYMFATFIPSLAVTVRRFHDQGYSGWMYFLIFIPSVGSLILFVFMCLEGNNGINKYGPDPKNPHFDDINEIGVH